MTIIHAYSSSGISLRRKNLKIFIFSDACRYANKYTEAAKTTKATPAQRDFHFMAHVAYERLSSAFIVSTIQNISPILQTFINIPYQKYLCLDKNYKWNIVVQLLQMSSDIIWWVDSWHRIIFIFHGTQPCLASKLVHILSVFLLSSFLICFNSFVYKICRKWSIDNNLIHL